MEQNASEEKIKFVTIELSMKQVDMEHPVKNKKNGKTYLRVIAPGGGTIFYPAEGLKTSKKDNSKVYFSRPEGTEITINYSYKNENVPDTATNAEKYKVNPFVKTLFLKN